MSKHNFARSLEAGKRGEELFASLHPKLKRTDGRRGDFITPNGNIVELKTDYYSMAHTENFFLERWSDKAAKKPGGPWQALEHGVKKFVYFYVKDLVTFAFDAQKLVDFLDQTLHNYRTCSIQNEGWTTEGVLVPRNAITHLSFTLDYKT